MQFPTFYWLKLQIKANWIKLDLDFVDIVVLVSSDIFYKCKGLHELVNMTSQSKDTPYSMMTSCIVDSV